MDWRCGLCGNMRSEHTDGVCPPKKSVPRGTSKRKKAAPEKAVQQAVVRVLEAAAFKVSDLSQPRATMQTPGLPDLYATSRRWGIALWVEVKAPDGKLSAAQEKWHEETRGAGETVVTVWGVDDMVRELQGLGVPIQN